MGHLVSVVIPYYGRWDLTHQRMNELHKFAPDNCEIVLVNDASPETDCRTGVAFWQKAHKNKVKYVENKENLGFGGSHNRGVKASEGDIVVLLSNDVIIYAPFIERIEEIIDSYDGNVMVCGRILYWDTGWNTIELNGKKSVVLYPEGWLLACTKELWKRIGGFDPIYGKFDAEDLDIGAWCLYNDVPMVALDTDKLKHIGEQTVRKVMPDREEYTKKNIIKFKEKWTDKLSEKFG